MSTATLLLFLSAVPAVAQGRVECNAVRSALMRRPVRYCALLPASYDQDAKRRYPVLYFLHGLFDNEQTLVNSGGWSLIERLREQGKIGDFILIAPEGGSSFYVNARDGGRPYEDFFLREFLPAVEGRYRVRGGRAARGITGFSMGGYGALHLAFRHPQLFGSVSAHSAALMDDTQGERLRVLVSRMPFLGDVFGRHFDARYWKAQNPLTLAATSAGLGALRIYFDCGNRDEWGFDSGAVALDAILKRRGIAHESHIYPGGHDWQYMAEHFPQSLEFHWKAFGAGR